MRRTRVQGREARDVIEKAGGGARKHQKPHKKSCRFDAEDGGDQGGRRRKRIQEIICSVNIDPGYVENNKEAEKAAQGARNSNKNCRQSTFLLSRLIRDFCNKYH